MFECNNKYWYKDSFIKVPENEEHSSFISVLGNESYVNESMSCSEIIKFIMNKGFARIWVTPKTTIRDRCTLCCEYNGGFTNQKKLYDDIIANLTPKIIEIIIETPYMSLTLTTEEFLNKSYLPKPKESVNNAMFGYGDLVALDKDIYEYWTCLKKGDIGIIIDINKRNLYAIYFQSKARYEWISASDIKLIRKFEWPE